MRRVVAAAAIGLALTLATLSVTWGLLFYRPLPTIDGHYRLLGLHERGEVVRDVFGIPRIYARDLHDLFFLQGYVTAQDRLAQMDAMRIAARARPSAPTGVDLAFAAVPVQNALAAYAEGVTKLIRQLRAASALPGEIVLAGRSPEDWSAADSMSITSAYLGSRSRCAMAPKTLSTKERPLLAADLVFDGPPPGLYEIGLAHADRRAIGVSLPGVPGLVAGHNGWIAWALLDAGRSGPSSALNIMLDLIAATRLDDPLFTAIGVRRIVVCAGDIYGVTANAVVPEAAAGRIDLEAMRALLGRPAAPVGARLLVDLADVDISRSAVSHGASGQRASPHFNDQTPLWELGQTHRLPFTRGATGRTDGELVLRAR